mmetsp:Transcript_6127/g.14106  ORF Transcript_6127/g.14106 Transcript_6127/m.14106 type:complete len:329 (-) Transcript_6127:530-1516(-)
MGSSHNSTAPGCLLPLTHLCSSPTLCVEDGSGQRNTCLHDHKQRACGARGRRAGRSVWRTAASLAPAGCSVAECLGGGIQARHIVLGLHQRVVRREVLAVARGLPLLVLLLGGWPVRLASSVQLGAECLSTGDTVRIQANLRKQILAHGAVLASVNARFPIDGVLARGHRPQERLEGHRREDLQAAEPPVLHAFAVLEVEAVGRDQLAGEVGHQAARHEHRVWIELHDPTGTLVHARFPNCLPGLVVQARIQPGAGLLSLREMEVPVGILQLHERSAGPDLPLLVAEYSPVLAPEDAGLPAVCSLEQLQVVHLLCAADVLHDHCEAVQ